MSKLDEEILLTGSELNANHMYSGQLLLKRRYPLQNGLKDTSYLAVKLLWPSKPVDFVQIVHVGSNHWACVSNKYCSTNEVELFDSMHNCDKSLHQSVVSQVCTILKSPANAVTIKVVNVQQQSGSTQCGLFALVFACDLCAGKDPCTRVYFESKLTNHLLKSFIAGEITPFPSRVRKSFTDRYVAIQSVDVFCVCRGPEQLPMACCDVCCEWYHDSCVAIPEELFDNSSSSRWLCDYCKVSGKYLCEPLHFCV